ncbi:aldo/keto reductase [Zychaea mexicana]|uniref:aldo/keto reductase n=1 Tax=Zychaea mexicana TaxID=64656 RepID=UPI0022FE829F|nr:aldo/keto reductase [Zychaea mexicana]KAI9496396.1 aldo/keto reductase [Zychaea mexicana]
MAQTRELGKGSAAFVNPLGLGCMGMSEFYGASDEETNMAVLDRALELGCSFWDTANVYGLGKNEELLGRYFAARGNRDKVFLCTKFGIVRDEAGKFLGFNGKPEYVRQCCEDSLKRLGVDTIDLYYQHRPDPNTPIEETMKALVELKNEGKIRHIGLSEGAVDEHSVDRMRRAHKVHPIAAYQVEFSPWTLDIETNDMLKTTRELGISIVAFCPLGRGFLTGAIKSPDDFGPDDYRKTSPRYSPENFPKNLELVKKIQTFAEKKGVLPSQLILAWVLAQGNDFITIPGTKRIKYLEENVKAGEVEFLDAEMKELREIIDTAIISGARYAPAQAVNPPK